MIINPYFRFALNPKKNQKRHPEDVLKSLIWSALVRATLYRHSAYAISKAVYPDRYVSNEFDVAENSFKFTNYQKGKHTPSDFVLKAIEKLAPKTSDVFHHVIWRILIKDKISGDERSDLTLNIEPKIRYHLRPNTKTASKEPKISRKSLDKIESFYNLDSLAAFVIILKDESFKLDSSHRKMVLLRIYRTILILCTSIPFWGLSLEFYVLICIRVFGHFEEATNLNQLDHVKVFTEKVKLMSSINLCFEDKSRTWNDQMSKDLFFNYFRGNYSVDLALELMPPGFDDDPYFEYDSNFSIQCCLNYII